MPLDANTKYPTWAEFNSMVDQLCPLEAKRLFGQMCTVGQTPQWNYTDGSSVFYRNVIRQAVMDLQNFIPEFNKNHETIYYQQDFVTDGMASVGSLPPMAKVKSAWYYSLSKQRRFRVVQASWEHRFGMASLHPRHISPNEFNGTAICQTAASLEMIADFNDLHREGHRMVGVMAIAPDHERFYLHPRIEGDWIFSLFWDGYKLEFRDGEQVPFGEEAAQAVAYFVHARFLSYVERNMADAAQATQGYSAKRSQLFIRTQSKGYIS